jgi:hypothetical protein
MYADFFSSLQCVLPQNFLRRTISIRIEVINFEVALYATRLRSSFETADEAFAYSLYALRISHCAACRPITKWKL